MLSKLEVLWSPVRDHYILWGGNSIASYKITKRDTAPTAGVLNVSNTHVAELICSANNQHQVRCMDIHPQSQGDEIVGLGSSDGKITVTYMAKLAWDGSGLPKKEFSVKYPRPCTSIHFNPIDSHLVAVGLEKYKPDNSILIYDISQVYGKRENTLPMVNSVESSKPVWEFAISEHCQNLCWFYNNTKILATGMNMKFIRLFDIRDLNRVVSSTVTKAAMGVCTNPKDDKYLASYIESHVYVWDTRNIEKPVQILPQSKPVLKIAWCPTKSNLLTTLQADSSSVTLYDIQHPTIGNEEVEPTVMERVINLKSTYPLTSFAWHRTDENRILNCGGSNASGKYEVRDFSIYDRIGLCMTPYFEFIWSHGKRTLKTLNIKKFPRFQDISIKIQTRAKAQYGLEDELYKNAEMVKDEEVLSNVWHWLHLSAKLVEEGKVVCSSLKTSFKHPGVLSVLMQDCENAPSEVMNVSWTDLGHINCKGSVKFYTRPERSMGLLLCCWPFKYDSFTSSGIISFVENLEKEKAYTRAAAIAVFNLQINLAIEVLNRAPPEAGLSYVGIALAGFSNEEESNWKKFCATALKKIADPYLKAMFAFLLSGSNNYESVLRETEMAVDDRVGFALVYLSDHKLVEYLNKLSIELCERGNLDGLLLTGNSSQGLKLLQNYLDNTADIQSTVLIAVRAFPHELDTSTVKNWIQNYQELLNSWKYWFERADFDLMVVNHKNERPPPQVFMSCTYCGKNISAHLRTLKNQQFSRLNVTGTSNKLTACPHCRKPLPRCVICLMTMGTAITDVDGVKPQSFDNWFTWCQSCRHGGHSLHLTNWFTEHLECPMVGCSCKCYSLDIISPAN
ncbi:hypothetical protein ABEB36_008691 [Hypothenemus hampei]|uniref:WD repeat protein mio zinc-ribbon like domain-containing protein n=1 Tax=Hypothenemus hampei TaxID=57062 RepID=A0ABD1EMR4_HYPHA